MRPNANTTITRDFHVYNGWVLLHNGDEDNNAFRIEDVQSIGFTEEGGPGEADVVTYKLRTRDYACTVRFDPADKCDGDHGSREGGGLAWALFDTVISDGCKGSEA